MRGTSKRLKGNLPYTINQPEQCINSGTHLFSDQIILGCSGHGGVTGVDSKAGPVRSRRAVVVGASAVPNYEVSLVGRDFDELEAFFLEERKARVGKPKPFVRPLPDPFFVHMDLVKFFRL